MVKSLYGRYSATQHRVGSCASLDYSYFVMLFFLRKERKFSRLDDRL